MKCSNGHDNLEGQQFCGTCGVALAPVASSQPDESPAIAMPASDKSADTTASDRRPWVMYAVVVAAVVVVAVIIGVVVSSGGGGSSDSASSDLVSDVAFNCSLTEGQVSDWTAETQDIISDRHDVSKNWILRTVRKASDGGFGDEGPVACKLFFEALAAKA